VANCGGFLSHGKPRSSEMIGKTKDSNILYTKTPDVVLLQKLFLGYVGCWKILISFGIIFRGFVPGRL